MCTDRLNFFDIQETYADRLMVICQNGTSLTYRQVWELQDELLRDVPPHSLLFLLCRNDPVPIAVYLGCLRKQIVPLLLPDSISEERLAALRELYHPAFLLVPPERKSPGWDLYSTGSASLQLHSDLALLLSTSGSTGSGKLVRLSRRNLQSNAESIAAFLNITEKERPVTSLPMEYTYGLSVINSHVLRGATLLVTNSGPLEQDFWEFLQRGNATSMAGVPYSYALWKRLRIFDMELPSLTSLTQAGGKLPADLQQCFGEWAAARGIRFTIMYGQTEATARMSYLPPDLCLKKPGSIGIPIPGGSFSLISDGPSEGELIYRGPNVSLGYAECAADLGRGDDNHGVLHTGDLARRDSDGFYYITGRKSRFVKIAGHRVSLDDLEAMLRTFDPAGTFLCTGDDTGIRIHVICDPLPDPQEAEARAEAIPSFLSTQTGIRFSKFQICFRTDIPYTSSGKIAYTELN